MRLRRPAPAHVALPSITTVVPGQGDGGWPDPAQLGRPGFDSSSLHQSALGHAYDLDAHAVADHLVAQVVPLLAIGVDPVDAPYLRTVLLNAARVGAGLGIAERSLEPRPGDDVVDRRLASAMWQARRGLPAMRPDWERTAAFLLVAGLHGVRGGPTVVDALAVRLRP